MVELRKKLVGDEWTTPKVNRFGWNLEHCDIVGGDPRSSDSL